MSFCIRLVFLPALFTFVLFAQGEPPWVTAPPDDDRYYHGIASSSLNEPDYTEKADNAALRQLSKQINTRVYADSRREINEVDDIATSKYENRSSLISISEIPGAEKKDSYKDRKRYHVYWRIDKDKITDNNEKNKKNALRNYKRYKKAMANNPAEKLKYLIPCLESMERALGVEFVDPDDEAVDLRVEVPSLINKIVSGISLDSEKQSFRGKVRQSLAEPIIVRVEYDPPTGSYGPRMRKVDADNIPIGIEFIEGDSELSSPLVRSDRRGDAKFDIIEIGTKSFKNTFFAFVDLKQFRANRSSFFSIDSYLDDIGKTQTLKFSLFTTEFTAETVAVIVNDNEEFFKKNNFKKVKTKFSNLLNNRFTSYEFKQDLTIQEMLDRWKKENKNVCTDFQCQLDIGAELQVNKLIFVDILKTEIDIVVNMMQTNIYERKLEYVNDYTFEVPYEAGDDDGRVATFLNSKAEDVVEHFWGVINPGILKLEMYVSNVKADIEKINPGKFDEKIITTRLDRNAEQKLIAGDYKVTLRRSGFEEKTFQASIGRSKTFVPTALQTELNPKTATKAFYKSLFIPGSGQRYTSEAGYESRSYVGWGFTIAAVGLGAATVSTWSDFSDKKDVYDSAYKTYLAQKLIEDVNTHRQIAEKKNQDMFSSQLTAIITTGLFAATWIGSAFEAKVNFPLYGVPVSSSGGFDIGLNLTEGRITPRLSYRWNI